MDILKMSKFLCKKFFSSSNSHSITYILNMSKFFFNVRSFFLIQFAQYHLFCRQLPSFTATVALIHRREMVNVTAYGLF
jgi:hypothetical protein